MKTDPNYFFPVLSQDRVPKSHKKKLAQTEFILIKILYGKKTMSCYLIPILQMAKQILHTSLRIIKL